LEKRDRRRRDLEAFFAAISASAWIVLLGLIDWEISTRLLKTYFEIPDGESSEGADT